MTKFKIFFNSYGKVTVNCTVKNGVTDIVALTMPKDVFGDKSHLPCIPKDIWDDWCKRFEDLDNFQIQDSLLYKRINPEEPAMFRNSHNFSFYITGDGITANYIADDQFGPYKVCAPNKCQSLFRQWFRHLVKVKFGNTPKK